MLQRIILSLALIALLTLAACAPAESTATPILATPTQEAAAAPTEPMAESPAAVTRPDWHNLILTDAATGESFTLADFAGQTVLVEPMATWCTNCRRQLGNVNNAMAQLDGQPFTFIALSVAENIADADLAAYARREGLNMRFAVATPELLTALTEQFGRAAITPPSTPHFIIGPTGTTSDLQLGSKSADALVTLLTEFSGA